MRGLASCKSGGSGEDNHQGAAKHNRRHLEFLLEDFSRAEGDLHLWHLACEQDK